MGPGKKALAKYDPDNDHDRRQRHPKNTGGRIRLGHQQAPGLNVVKAQADQRDGQGGEQRPNPVNLDPFLPLNRLEPEAQQENHYSDY